MKPDAHKCHRFVYIKPKFQTEILTVWKVIGNLAFPQKAVLLLVNVVHNLMLKISKPCNICMPLSSFNNHMFVSLLMDKISDGQNHP